MKSRSKVRSTATVNGHGHAPGPVRSLMKERAYEEIKRRLLADAYPPGSFLAERQLAGELGMSKTPVKAALGRLEVEGFITVSPQQGIVVRELTVWEIVDLYEIRAALEAYTLRANLKAQEAIRGAGDVPAGVALDAEFLGNREILRVMGQLREKMQRVVTAVFRLSPGRIDTSYDEHRAIAEAVIGGEGRRAADLITRHLELGKRLILSPRS